MKRKIYQLSLFGDTPELIDLNNIESKTPASRNFVSQHSASELAKNIMDSYQEYPDGHVEQIKMKEQLRDLNNRHILGINVDKVL